MSEKKERLKNLILGFLNAGGAMSRVKLAKLILFSDIEHYNKTGKTITGLYYVRLPWGPLVAFFEEILAKGEEKGLWDKKTSEIPIYQEMKLKEQYTYRSKKPDKLNSEEKETIEDVLNKYGTMSATMLSELSHEFPAWKYSEPMAPIYISELCIKDEKKYFAFIDAIEEKLDSVEEEQEEFNVADQLSRDIPEIKK